MFKQIFAILAIGTLVLSGIRAPEVREFSRGICWSGTTLEKAASSETRVAEFHPSTSHPVILHAGFSASLHPFDFPVTVNLSDLPAADSSEIPKQFIFENRVLFSHDRPPISFAF